MSFSFAQRAYAAEGQWFNFEDRQAILKRLERLVDDGKVDKSILEKAQKLSSPVEIIKARDVSVFQYKPGRVPPPRKVQTFNLGTQFSLGRARWTTEDASIFSVSDGKRLASTPAKSATYYENLRMMKIQRAALETPTIAGYRLLPEFTPGRAMMWGTILAIWGTAAVVVSIQKSLGIQDAVDAPEKLRTAIAPWVAEFKTRFAPLKESLSIATTAGAAAKNDTIQSQLVKQLKVKLMAH